MKFHVNLCKHNLSSRKEAIFNKKVQLSFLIQQLLSISTGNKMDEFSNFYMVGSYIGVDRRGYQVNIFLISPQKHMLWVLIRSASPRRF